MRAMPLDRGPQQRTPSAEIEQQPKKECTKGQRIAPRARAHAAAMPIGKKILNSASTQRVRQSGQLRLSVGLCREMHHHATAGRQRGRSQSSAAGPSCQHAGGGNPSTADCDLSASPVDMAGKRIQSGGALHLHSHLTSSARATRKNPGST